MIRSTPIVFAGAGKLTSALAGQKLGILFTEEDLKLNQIYEEFNTINLESNPQPSILIADQASLYHGKNKMQKEKVSFGTGAFSLSREAQDLYSKNLIFDVNHHLMAESSIENIRLKLENTRISFSSSSVDPVLQQLIPKEAILQHSHATQNKVNIDDELNQKVKLKEENDFIQKTREVNPSVLKLQNDSVDLTNSNHSSRSDIFEEEESRNLFLKTKFSIPSTNFRVNDSPEPNPKECKSLNSEYDEDNELNLAKYPRFLSDFDVLERLNSGAFGVCYKALHKLDKHLYAVKKICFQQKYSVEDKFDFLDQKQVKQVVQEANIMASIGLHPNIVRYYTSWIECNELSENSKVPDTIYNLKKRNKSFENSSFISDSNCSINSNYNSFENSSNDSYFNEHIYFSEELGSSVQFNENSSQQLTLKKSKSSQNVKLKFSNDESERMRLRNQTKLNNTEKFFEISLFIQMELCDSMTLFDWLRARENKTNQQKLSENFIINEIFLQIINGLAFLHTHGIAHRDLKPTNIFHLDGNWQIGDFGLSIQFHNGIPFMDGSNESPKFDEFGVGTYLYQAPEMTQEVKTLKEAELVDQFKDRCDIYSTGIILFELCIPFVTMMERAEAIQNLRNYGKLPDQLHMTSPEYAPTIVTMVSKLPSARPTAISILNSQLFQGKHDDKIPSKKTQMTNNVSDEPTDLSLKLLLEAQQSRIYELERIVNQLKIQNLKTQI